MLGVIDELDIQSLSVMDAMEGDDEEDGLPGDPEESEEEGGDGEEGGLVEDEVEMEEEEGEETME